MLFVHECGGAVARARVAAGPHPIHPAGIQFNATTPLDPLSWSQAPVVRLYWRRGGLPRALESQARRPSGPGPPDQLVAPRRPLIPQGKTAFQGILSAPGAIAP